MTSHACPSVRHPAIQSAWNYSCQLHDQSKSPRQIITFLANQQGEWRVHVLVNMPSCRSSSSAQWLVRIPHKP